MDRVLDTLENKIKQISNHPHKILDESFMMGIFTEFSNELPEFKEYWDMTFKKKRMSVIARKSGTKVVHFAKLHTIIFSPTRKTNKATSARVKELAKTAVDAILKELHDKSKATSKDFAVSGSEHLWKKCLEEQKKNTAWQQGNK